MPSEALEPVVLGRLTKPHGHRGAMRMFPYFSPAQRLGQLKSNHVMLRPSKAAVTDAQARPSRIVRHFPHKEFVIVELEGVATMNDAELLRNWEVVVAQVDLWPLDEGQVFAFDLTGREVFDETTQTFVGTVVDVVTLAGTDYLEVQREGKGTFLVPLLDEFVADLTSEGPLKATLPPGLTEL